MTENYLTYDEERTCVLKCSTDALGHVAVANGVQKIGINAFKDCKDIASISLPSSIRTISSGAFKNCDKLKSIYFEGEIEDWLQIDWLYSFGNGYKLYFNGELVEEVTIPQSVTALKYDAFYYCQSLKTVHFHEGLVKIGGSAFNKTGLDKIVNLPSNLEEIGNYAFFNSNIKGVKIGGKVKSIGEGAFAACYSLFSIILDDDIENYGCDQKRFLYEKTSRGDKLIAIAYGFPFRSSCTIPSHIVGIAVQCFCFSCIPDANGITIDHDLAFVEEKAFRSAKGTVNVPIGKRKYFQELGIPADLIKEHFVFSKAFLTEKHYINAVVNNPFRILGVDVAAKAKVITANATKIKRYNDVGKTIDFPSDRSDKLPQVNRSTEMVDWALAQINLPKDKLRYALLWYGDNEAALADEELDDWRGRLNNAADAILKKDLNEAVNILTHLIHEDENNDFEDFVAAVAGENFEIEQDELAHLFIDTLLESLNIPSCRLLFKASGKTWEDDQYLNNKVYGLYEEKINREIDEASKVDDEDPDASLAAAKKLKGSAALMLADFKAVVDDDDETRYTILADQLSERILQSTIDYYNNSIDRQAAVNTLELAEFALSIAVGQKQIDRCNEQRDIIKKIVNRQPPIEVWTIDDALSAIIAKHREKFEKVFVSKKVKDLATFTRVIDEYKTHPTDDAIDMLSEAAPLLFQVRVIAQRESDEEKKERLTNYMHTASDRVAHFAIEISVVDFNMMSELHIADYDFALKTWSLMVGIGTLPISDELRNGRLKAGKDTMTSNMRGMGIKDATRLAVKSPIDLRTEEEIWKECRTLVDYTYYQRRFPKGKYHRQVKTKIEELTWDNAKRNRKPESYLKTYPQGAFVAEALALEDDIAWGKCKTEYDCEKYLRDYPNGAHISQARQKIDAFVAEREFWNSHKDYSKGCKEYLDKYPHGEYKGQAEKYLADVKKQATRLEFALGILVCLFVAFICLAYSATGIFLTFLFGALLILIIFVGKNSN